MTDKKVSAMEEEDTAVVSTTTSDTAPAERAEEVRTQSGEGDAAMDEEDDEARPEATFRFTVENFSQVKDSALSPPCMVRNLPWKIMIMPRPAPERPTSQQQGGGGGGGGKSLGYFLQCNGESEAASWSCQASAELKIVSQKEGVETFSRKIQHLFYSKENDWGFSHYMTWGEVMDPEKGFIRDDKVTFEVRVTADAPHGVCWDSKKHTGYVGLKNQGATCYMNSLLQVLYFTNSLRRSVYKMPTEADDSAKSVGLALQRVFHDLQFLDKSVGTKKLTKSFGWETLDSFMQHDVQEFLRVLLDKLEIKMKGTCVEGTIPKLFEGKMVSYIRCKNVDYTSSRVESFYDIQLPLKGKKDIYESFADYVTTENLDGENKYDAGPEHGLQDAEKGILFTSFPPVLHLHLMRFQYDPVTDSSVKFNDRFCFPYELDLSDFLKTKEGNARVAESAAKNMETDAAAGAAAAEAADDEAMDVDGNDDDDPTKSTKYLLHAVLVHSGDNHGGHYVVFINPKGDGRWCKFDDDVVSRCAEKEAINNNFGGAEDGDVAARQSSNAYMLVYIRKSVLRDTLTQVTEADIPSALVERLAEEKHLEAARRREKQEAHLYMTLRILTEDAFVGHQGNDLYEPDKVVYQEMRVRKQSCLKEVMEIIAKQAKQPVEQLRIWPLTHRTNQTLRPSLVDMESDMDKHMIEVADNTTTLTLFLEMSNPEEPTRSLRTFDKDQDVMLFFKYYDPRKEKINYMGHMYVSITSKLSSVVPELLRRADLPEGTTLLLFEEIKPNMLERIEDIDKPLEHVLEELMDGDILVFQREVREEEAAVLRLPFSRDYFRDLFHRVDVTFVDKNIQGDPGFALTLSQRMNYKQIVRAVGAKLDVDANKLQLFKAQNYRDVPGHALRCTFEGTLKDLLVYFRPKQPKKIFYQKLSIPIHELENKRQIKCYWLSPDHKTETELTLYPPKSGTVQDLLREAREQVDLSKPNVHLRLLDIISHKITQINEPEARIESLASPSTKSYRVEEVPTSQEKVGDDELLVPVAHFQKEVYSTFGHPFLVKLKDGESFESVKSKIQEHLDLPDKEFEKYRVAVITMSRAKYLEDLPHNTVRLREFNREGQGTGGSSPKPYIGLEHINKNSKRPRYNYMEKAIKIYN